MSTPRRFEVTPPDMRFPVLVVAATILATVAAVVLAWREPGADRTLWWLFALLLLLPAMMVLALTRRRVSLDGTTLHVVAGLNRTRINVSALRLDEARTIDLDTHPELRPGIKTLGTAMPGYQAGHFRQPGGRKVFALVTDRHRVLALPARDGRLLLLSMTQPRALLDALHRASPSK